jgi:hypothetical protein
MARKLLKAPYSKFKISAASIAVALACAGCPGITKKPVPVTLTVKVEGEMDRGRVDVKPGPGRIRSISCPPEPSGDLICTWTYDGGTTVTLSAIAFAGGPYNPWGAWIGACESLASTCSVYLNQDTTVRAIFFPIPR